MEMQYFDLGLERMELAKLRLLCNRGGWHICETQSHALAGEIFSYVTSIFAKHGQQENIA